MKTIPEELLEQLERGNVLLFIGEGIVRDAAGEVALERLAAELVVGVGIRDAEGVSAFLAHHMSPLPYCVLRIAYCVLRIAYSQGLPD